MSGVCPHCEKTVSSLQGKIVEAAFEGGKKYKVMTYACLYCHKVIGCEMEPIAIRNGIVETLAAEIRSLKG